jgi:hypothetical protein
VQAWLLLHYKVAREPSAHRVYVWRKLKRLGAVLLHDAIWVLPDTPRTREQFQWLAAEVVELEGEALVWQAQLLPAGQQEENLIKQFNAQVEAGYQEILVELAQFERASQISNAGEAAAVMATDNKPDLKGLSRRYQQLYQQDYFHSVLGQKVREGLEAASRNLASEKPERREEKR